MSIADLLSSVAIWSGAFVGVLKVTEWLLSERQKKAIAAWSIRTWVWLDDQRLGKFVAAVRSRRAQIALSVLAHLMLLSMVLVNLGTQYFGLRVFSVLSLGNPRLYQWQGWIDAASLLLSLALVSYYLHPRLTRWIGTARSTLEYFARLLACVLSAAGVAVAYVAIVSWYMPEVDLFIDPSTYQSRFEAAFGGRNRVVVVHALSAILAGPILAQSLLLVFILYLSLYWTLFVLALMACHWCLKLVALRVAEHKDGPVLGLSALLVAVGGGVKAFL